MPRPTFTAKEHQIADKLLHLCAIVERNGLGNRAAVAAVARRVLPHVPDPRMRDLAQRARDAEHRADVAEAELARLKTPTVDAGGDWHPPHRDPWRVVELSPRCAEALTEMCAGSTIPDVAEHLGVTYSSAVNLLNRAVHDVGATDRAQAVALATSGAVRVRVRDKRKDAAA